MRPLLLLVPRLIPSLGCPQAYWVRRCVVVAAAALGTLCAGVAWAGPPGALLQGAWELREIEVKGETLSPAQWAGSELAGGGFRRVLIIEPTRTVMRTAISLPSLGDWPLICEAEVTAASSIGRGRLRIRDDAEGGATIWTPARTTSDWTEAAVRRGCSARLDAGVMRWTIDGDGSAGDTMAMVEGDVRFVYARLPAGDSELNPVAALNLLAPQGASDSAPELEVSFSLGGEADATPLSDLARELGFELLRAPPRPGSPAAAETVAAYRRGLELAPGAPDEVLNQLVQANAAILPWPGFDPNRSVATPRGSACDELRLPPRVGLDDGLELLGEDACRAIAGLGDALEAIVAARVDGARVDPMSMESAWSFEGAVQRDLSVVALLVQAALIVAELTERSGDSSAAASMILELLRFVTDLQRSSGLEARAQTDGPQGWLRKRLEETVEDPSTDPAILQDIVRVLAEEGDEQTSFGHMMRIEVLLILAYALDGLRQLDVEGLDPFVVPEPIRGTVPPAEAAIGILNYGVAVAPVWRELLSWVDSPPPERRQRWVELEATIAAIETPVDWLLEAGEHPNVRDQMQVQFDLLRRWDTRITYGQTHRCLVLHGARAALYEARHGALPASLAEIEAALGNDDPSCDLDPFTLEDWVLQRGAGEWRLTSPAADRAEELGLWADAPGRLTIHVVSRAAGIR